MNRKILAILLTIVLATLLLATLATAAASVPQDIAWRQQGAMAHFKVPSGSEYVTIDVVAAQQMAVGSGDNVVYLKVTHLGTHGTSERTYTASFDSFSLDAAQITLNDIVVDFISSRGTTGTHDLIINWNMETGTTTNQFTDMNGDTVIAPGQWKSGLTADNDEATITMTHRGTSVVYTSEWAAIGIQTRPIVGSCNLAGDYKSSFGVGENVFAQGTGYALSQSYNAYVVRDTTWTNGLVISTTDVIETTAVTSDASGVIPAQKVYNNAQLGLYDIVIDVNGNGVYDVSVDALCDNIIFTGGFVVPEYALGGALLALVSCFAAFAIVRRRDTHTKRVTP